MTPKQSDSLWYTGIPQGVLVGIIGLVFTGLLQARGHLPQGILVTLAGATVLGFIGGGINRLMFTTGERAANSLYNPSGDTTKYTPTFSHIEALEVRGDLDGAAKAWEEACAEHPTNAIVLAKTGDFHLRLRKDPEAALGYYKRIRELEVVSTDMARYASQKLVDLYLGPLNDEGRALVELRRLADRFAGTREADDALAVLAKLKAERRAP